MGDIFCELLFDIVEEGKVYFHYNLLEFDKAQVYAEFFVELTA